MTIKTPKTDSAGESSGGYSPAAGAGNTTTIDLAKLPSKNVNLLSTKHSRRREFFDVEEFESRRVNGSQLLQFQGSNASDGTSLGVCLDDSELRLTPEEQKDNMRKLPSEEDIKQSDHNFAVDPGQKNLITGIIVTSLDTVHAKNDALDAIKAAQRLARSERGYVQAPRITISELE